MDGKEKLPQAVETGSSPQETGERQAKGEKTAPRLVIVTGMSGGGKTQASRYLEDLGYFCVDNLPPVFIPKFVELCAHAGGHVSKVVLVVDTRSREFFDTFVQVLEDMDKSDTNYEMLFMDASDAAIIRRYKETRRRHPMAPASRITEGIAKERERLAPVRAKATYIIDTSELKKVQLRDKIHRLFGTSEGEQMNINVLSFGFKFGMPLDADMVLDVRFLPNPFYIESMRHKSGAVPEVADYIAKFPVTQEFLKKLDDLLDFLVPQYVKEGKSQLVIAVGCTGGMHRSVFVAKHIFDRLGSRGYPVKLEHRDLMKNDVWEHVREEC
ncbi:MAG: RNase adapter RapZ [Selenomonas sp.]|nr:RNase adapter RapZ [Selenomonas sp.]